MVVDNFKYIKWLSAEDTYLMTKQWLSELQFVKGEQASKHSNDTK